MSEEKESTRRDSAPVAVPIDVEDPSLYFNREISWLAFNDRVLDEALDARWPLLERVKFLAIFYCNLDEFFMIRVSGLHEQLEARIGERSPDGLTASEQLARIGQIVRQQLARASEALSGDLLPLLDQNGIRIHDWKSLDGDVKRRARAYFRKAVFPVLTPLAVDPGHPFPFLSNLSLSLAVEARDPETGERNFARVKVPESLPRFVPLDALEKIGGRRARQPPLQNFLPMEVLIAANLDDLFPGMDIVGCHPFRVTRDMDMEIREEEAHDLLSVVDREVRRRKFGAVVRLEVAPGIPDRVRQTLHRKARDRRRGRLRKPGVPRAVGIRVDRGSSTGRISTILLLVPVDSRRACGRAGHLQGDRRRRRAAPPSVRFVHARSRIPASRRRGTRRFSRSR